MHLVDLALVSMILFIVPGMRLAFVWSDLISEEKVMNRMRQILRKDYWNEGT